MAKTSHIDPREIITARSVPEPNTGCWLWTWGLKETGYGQLNYRGKQWRAHVLSYEAFKGPVPDGLDLDHLCRVRSCVNPDHLEPVTRSVNLKRSPLTGRSPASVEALNRMRGSSRRAITHCPQGHEYTPENTYRAPGRTKNERQCLTCIRARSRKRRLVQVRVPESVAGTVFPCYVDTEVVLDTDHVRP